MDVGYVKDLYPSQNSVALRECHYCPGGLRAPDDARSGAVEFLAPTAGRRQEPHPVA